MSEGNGHPSGHQGGHPTGHPGEKPVGHPGGHSGGHPGHATGGHPGQRPAGHPDVADRFVGQYEGGAPWDIGRPQPELVAIAEEGVIDPATSRILDVGCGRGDNALFFAERGAEVVGVDAVDVAVRTAREHAAERGLEDSATFFVGEVIASMPEIDAPFDAVVDCGFFHALADDDRERFARALAQTLRPGGCYVMLAFSERVPGAFGPRRVSEAEIRATFAEPEFVVEAVRPAALHSAVGHMPIVDANLAVIRRAE